MELNGINDWIIWIFLIKIFWNLYDFNVRLKLIHSLVRRLKKIKSFIVFWKSLYTVAVWNKILCKKRNDNIGNQVNSDLLRAKILNGAEYCETFNVSVNTSV